MAEKQKRICMCCGKIFKYCPSCGDHKPNEQWRLLVHDEKCLEINHILTAYRGGEITQAEAKKRMSKIKPNIDDVLKNDSMTANQVKVIFGVEEKVEETPEVISDEVVEEKQVEETNVTEEAPVVEEVKVNEVETKSSRKRK